MAEDNPGDVELVREALLEHEVSCELRVISDGAAVLAYIEDLERDGALPCPDLLLLDLHLPKHPGQEILTKFRGGKRCGQTPIVILTSSDSTDDQRKAADGVVLHYFRKPTNLKAFLQLGAIAGV
jgi:CheY-like chemotaxis protein